MRHLESGITFYVFTTHLKAKIGFEEVRAVEAKALLDAIAVETSTFPTILTGDFNDTPDSKALQLVFADDSFKSAYGPSEPEYTTSKWREATGM